MNYDALTTASMAAELQTLCPGCVQQALVVDAHSIGLEIYAAGRRAQLLLCADPAAARVLVVEYKLRRGVEQETPLLLLLRKYVRDSVLTAVVQSDVTERILQLDFDHKEYGPTRLIVELIGRRPNLLLVRPDGRILECLHHAPATIPQERALLPGRNYAPPPTQGKLSPFDDGQPSYYAQIGAIVGAEGKLWKAIVAAIAGMSPAAARELAWRVTGNADAPASEANLLALAAALQALWEPIHSGAWTPGWAERDGQVSGFAAYQAHTLGEFHDAASMSEALARYYAPERLAERAAAADTYAGQRANAKALLRRARQQLERRLEALTHDEPPPGAAEQMRQAAEWLLALNSQIAPGQAMLEVTPDPAQPHDVIRIPLDPARGPIAQAEQMFRRAGKLERAAVFIPQRRAQLQLEMEFLDQLALDLEQAANQPEIATVIDELRVAGLLKAPSTAAHKTASVRVPKAGEPLRFRSVQGLEIVVGRNARQNEHVTFDLAHPNDLWLHVRGTPGAHVIVRLAGAQATAETRRAAAQLAAYHSSVRGERRVDVIITQRRAVSHAPGGKPGQVLVKHAETVTVPAEMPDGVTALKRPDK